MKVLLDENFPLGLVPALQADGLQVEHVIALGWRGASDTFTESIDGQDIPPA